MCNAIGVDPSAAANVAGGAAGAAGRAKNKGWWDTLTRGERGEVGFLVRVAMRIVEECNATRGENGGLLGVKEVRERVRKGEVLGGGMEVTEEDVLKAVESLRPLGSGFSVVTIGNRTMIRSVPKQLNEDQSVVLGVLQDLGYLTVALLEDNFGWETERAQTVLDDLLTDSLVWLNEKGEDNKRLHEKEYWSPAGLESDED